MLMFNYGQLWAALVAQQWYTRLLKERSWVQIPTGARLFSLLSIKQCILKHVPYRGVTLLIFLLTSTLIQAAWGKAINIGIKLFIQKFSPFKETLQAQPGSLSTHLNVGLRTFDHNGASHEQHFQFCLTLKTRKRCDSDEQMCLVAKKSLIAAAFFLFSKNFFVRL